MSQRCSRSVLLVALNAYRYPLEQREETRILGDQWREAKDKSKELKAALKLAEQQEICVWFPIYVVLCCFPCPGR